MQQILSFFSLFLTFFMSSLSHAADPNKHYDSVHDFLQDQAIIRIAADNTPGFGNQATSASLIDRLRQMGFAGKVEFVYANLTTPKITTLFDLPLDIPDAYFDPKTNIEFIKLKEFVRRHKNKLNEQATLSLIGRGDDFGCGLAREDGVDVDHGMGSLDCQNDANFLDADMHYFVSPFYNETTYFRIFNDSDPKPGGYIPHSENQFFVMPVSNMKKVHDYLDNDPRGQTLLKQKPAFVPFLRGMEEKKFNVLPTYGYSVQEIEKCKECFPSNILQIITAARYVQQKSDAPIELKNKGLIIAIFYDYQKEADALMNVILPNDHWGIYEVPGAEEARKIIKALGLRSTSVFSTASISDPATIKRIENLSAGQILLLSLGSLPKVVFDGIYTYTDTNIWPPIREGANSFNSLILTGRPHIRCGWHWEIGYDRLHDPVLKKQFENFYDGHFCQGPKTWQKTPDIYQLLGQFFIDANDPNSAFSRYFAFLKEEAFKPENDRIHVVVDDNMKRINKLRSQS